MYINEEFAEGTLVIYDYERAEKHWDQVIENNGYAISRWIKPRPKKLENFKNRILKIEKTNYNYRYDERYKIKEWVCLNNYDPISNEEIKRKFKGFIEDQVLEKAIEEKNNRMNKSFPFKIYHCTYIGEKGKKNRAWIPACFLKIITHKSIMDYIAVTNQ